MMGWRMYEQVLLALTMWREARGEGRECLIQVGCTARDRVDHPKWWGKDYISVLTKKWQYSSLTDPKDRQLTTWPAANDHIFEECLTLAGQIIDRTINPLLKGADSYYDASIAPPAWATPDKLVGRIGRITFYNIDGQTED
ncbi:MAG: hypothetical protein K0S79_90 [Nitrospira sp.]|jgi:spore germination cell wall hydrolase CwlJ-like protein|nr:hypothetical protein [Nitrospira sp.]